MSDEYIKTEYVVKNRAVKDIATELGVSDSAIYNKLRRMKVLPKPRDDSLKISMELRTNKNKAFFRRVDEISQIIGEPVNEYINRMYWDKECSPKQIGEHLGLSASLVTQWMPRLGIRLRSRSDAVKLHIKTNPSAHQRTTQTFKDETIREKAYEANRKLRQGKTVEEIYGVEEGKRLRRLYSDQRKGELNPIYGTKRPQHVCDALSKAHKGKKQSPEFRIKRLKKAFEKLRMSPNKLEMRITNIIKDNNLPFKFVGDGSMIIHGFCPDFVSIDGSMKIIEVFGDYWHGEKNPDLTYVRTEEGRKQVFADLGYEMLVLWESKINSSTDEQLHDEIISFIN